MNLQQVKQDVDNGVMVSKVTWLKVLEAALVLEGMGLVYRKHNVSVKSLYDIRDVA